MDVNYSYGYSNQVSLIDFGLTSRSPWWLSTSGEFHYTNQLDQAVVTKVAIDLPPNARKVLLTSKLLVILADDGTLTRYKLNDTRMLDNPQLTGSILVTNAYDCAVYDDILVWSAPISDDHDYPEVQCAFSPQATDVLAFDESTNICLMPEPRLAVEYTDRLASLGLVVGRCDAVKIMVRDLSWPPGNMPTEYFQVISVLKIPSDIYLRNSGI